VIAVAALAAACGDASPPEDASATAKRVAAAPDRVPASEPAAPADTSGARPGRWRRIPVEALDPQRDAEQIAMIEQLEAIGYASGSAVAVGHTGLTRSDPEHTTPGYTFVTSGHAPEAFLIDPEGTIIHRWHKGYQQLWPKQRMEQESDPASFWRRARLLPDGHVIAIFDGLGMLELDVDSNVVWARENGAHHDLDVGPDGNLYVLTREAQMLPEINPSNPILEDFIEVIDRDGDALRRISLLEAFENSPWAELGRSTWAKGGDLFHMNSLTLLDDRISEQVPAFRSGNVLISSFPLHVIAVVDLDREALVWLRRGSFRNQHDPQILSNDNLLLFDNRGGNRGDHRESAVLELDPETGVERWAYRGTQDAPFYSSTCGTAQRLPDGNTLVTESDRGRAFELTADGEIVWEYLNPHRTGEQGQLIATLFEAWRLPAGFPLDWLPGAAH